jgi:hypothetical protein
MDCIYALHRQGFKDTVGELMWGLTPPKEKSCRGEAFGRSLYWLIPDVCFRMLRPACG